jgi:hypothetical protein
VFYSTPSGGGRPPQIEPSCPQAAPPPPAPNPNNGGKGKGKGKEKGKGKGKGKRKGKNNSFDGESCLEARGE